MHTFIFLIAALTTVQGGNILLYPYGHCLNSHLLNAETLATMLMDHGHKVSMVISEMYNDFQHKEYTHSDSRLQMVQFSAPQNYTPICDYDTVDFMMYAPLQERFNAFIDTSVRYCDQLLSDRSLLNHMKAQNYDVFIVESLDPCGKILADFLDVPFIPLMTTGLGHWDGNPRLPSYLPSAIAPFTNHMTFPQRIGNLIMKFMYETIPVVMGFDTPFEELKAKYSLNQSLSISTTLNRAAIKLINSDFAIEYPAPVEPDSILVGGFAVSAPKQLSPELEAWMRSAGPAGVIVMSTGTLVKTFNSQWTSVFMNAFARLPQKVIWRYYNAVNSSDMPNVPDNVRLERWIPQRDLLAHQSTRAFITHCGLNAMFEAAYSGVPVVAVPMSGDQMNNAAKLTDHAGMGVKVDMFSITSDGIYDALQTVLSSPYYKNNAHSMATRIRDQPISVKDKVNYWVDYVIRHKGAQHLRSSARHMSTIQYFSLDVLATLAAVLISVVTLLGGLLWCAIWSLYKHIQGRALVHKTKED